MTITVYRVQDVDGRGPFRPGFSHWWVEERPDHDNLAPWMEQFGWDAFKRSSLPHRGCACRTLDQLRRWFTASEYATLQRFGFQAVQMDAARVLHESSIQLLFERSRPLQVGVTPAEMWATAEAAR